MTTRVFVDVFFILNQSKEKDKMGFFIILFLLSHLFLPFSLIKILSATGLAVRTRKRRQPRPSRILDYIRKSKEKRNNGIKAYKKRRQTCK